VEKAMRNYWLDVLMGLLAFTVGLSAFLLWVVFPQGYFAARLIWLEIHKWTGLGLSIAVLLHVVLHWRWLTQMTKRASGALFQTGVRSLRSKRQDRDPV
jgi:membrane protein implicated in regulation of membrane protease activity